MLEPATRATGTPPLIRLLEDVLLGAVFGALLGFIAALAGSRSTIDTRAAPPVFDVGREEERAGQEIKYGLHGIPLQQSGLEYARQKADRDGPLDRPELEPV